MESQMLLFSKILLHTFPPVRGSRQAAGFDLFSDYDYDFVIYSIAITFWLNNVN